MSGKVQLKVPMAGTWVETQNREVWMDPQRDIAHAMTHYLQRADRVLQDTSLFPSKWWMQQGLTEEDHKQLCEALVRYVQLAAAGRVREQRLAMAESGLDRVPMNAMLVWGYCLAMVLMAAFFHGVRDAAAGKNCDIEHIGLEVAS